MSLEDALAAINRAAPTLDPATVYGVATASGGGVDSSIDNAKATAAYQSTVRLRQDVENQDRFVQRTMWDKFGPATKAMLMQAGYDPPEISGVSNVGHAITEVTGAAVGGALHGLGVPLRAVKHAYRSARLMGEEEALAGRSRIGPQAWAKTFTPGEWSRAWDATESEERTFDPIVEKALLGDQSARDKMGTDYAGGMPTLDKASLEYAKDLSEFKEHPELGIQKALERVPPEQRQDLYERLTSDPDIQKAVTVLEGGKFSLGRSVALTAGLDPVKSGKLWTGVSGSVDVVASWYGDPFIAGTEALKAVNAVKYVANSAADVARIVEKPTVVRHLDEVASYLGGDKARVGALLERYPQYAPIADSLVKEGVKSTEGLQAWFKGEAGTRALVEGRLSGLGERVIPHTTALGSKALDVKVGTKKAIDWMADSGGIWTPIGKIGRRMTTLVPRGFEFNATDPQAITQIQRLAASVLPAARTRELVDAWVHAETLGLRRGVYKGLMSEMFEAAGVHATDRGRQFAQDFLQRLDDSIAQRAYSVADLDKISLAGSGERVAEGLLENQIAAVEWAMPSFRTLWGQTRRHELLEKLGLAGDRKLFDSFMETAWKPTTLLRLGFPVRAGGEELVGAVMREGLLPILKGRAAASVAVGEERLVLGISDRILPYNPLRATWARWKPFVPEHVREPLDVAASYMGGRAAKAFRYVEGRFAGEEYVKGARELMDRYPALMPAEISANHSPMLGLASPENALKMSRDGRMRPIYFRHTGKFKEYVPTEEHAVQAWHTTLDEMANSDMARVVLATVDRPRAEQVQAVVDVLSSPRMNELRTRATRFHQTPDGRKVGELATEDEALADWASRVVDHVNAHVRAPDGTLTVDTAAMVTSRKGPTMNTLEGIGFDLRPDRIKGPEVVMASGNAFTAFIDKGFAELVGKPMDWMVRQPLFVHNYVAAKKEATALVQLWEAGGKSSEFIEQGIQDAAIQRAINKTTPFIHDPQMRSQLSVIGRNFAPFWFAQEQFYKRWIKMAAHSPEAFRQAQLVMMGLRHSGVLKQDENGDDYFMYPGVGAVQTVITKAVEMLPGDFKATLPMPASFSGKVKFATPGLERLGLPSFGPYVAIAMHGMRSMFPELTDVEEQVLGERGAGRPYWEQITPTTITRAIHVATDHPESSPQMASAMMQAIQYLDASGHGLSDNPTPEEHEQYIDRVRNWTRILMVNRTLFGFSVPASPELQLDPDHFSKEYRQLMDVLPIEEATAVFIKRHPDASAYTVFQSESASGLPLPATGKTFEFMDHHFDFLKAYPAAAAAFLPQTPGEGFSQAAYREQLVIEMRRRKDPKEFLRDVKFQAGADVYFEAKRSHEEALKSYKGTPMAAAERNQWSYWKDQFLKTHPIFADELMSTERASKKMAALNQLHQALADPRVPDTSQTGNLRQLLESYDNHLAYQQQSAGYNTTAAKRARSREAEEFATWADQFVTDNPDVKTVYDKLMREDTG